MDLKLYKKINASYKKTLIFHLGCNAGFFTEYTYMINAMLFCLQNRIRFVLYSSDANFGTGVGWNEFFQPFCEEDLSGFHHKFNYHRVPSWKTIIKASIKKHSLKFVLWKSKSLLLDIWAKIYSMFLYHKNILLTQDIRFNPDVYFNFPDVGLKGDYLSVFGEVSKMVWQFNNFMSDYSENAKQQLALPTLYSACQIRGGDKITETRLIPQTIYMEPIKKAGLQTVFVLTDDYRILSSIEEENAGFDWKTLCQPEEKGYDHKKFCSSDADFRRNSIAKLLTSVQILMEAQAFIGSITCGPSVFLLKLKYPNGEVIDCSRKDLKKALTLDITHRGSIAQKFLTELTT